MFLIILKIIQTSFDYGVFELASLAVEFVDLVLQPGRLGLAGVELAFGLLDLALAHGQRLFRLFQLAVEFVDLLLSSREVALERLRLRREFARAPNQLLVVRRQLVVLTLLGREERFFSGVLVNLIFGSF